MFVNIAVGVAFAECFADDAVPTLCRAAALSPLDPSKVQLEAGKILLRKMQANVTDRSDFAFETTLSGRSYVRLLKEWVSTDWKVVLFYLWIPSAEFSRLRVEQRVESGGHDIPDEAIARRYKRTVSNFLNVFAPLCDEVFCCDNSELEHVMVFADTAGNRTVWDKPRYQTILEGINE